MFRVHVGALALLLAAGLAAADAQQYVISTYAGGAPTPPSAALSIATDTSGNVYFVDGFGYIPASARSNSVFKIDPSGAITRVAGDFRTGFSGDGAKATSASLTAPRGVAVDGAGNVFIVDAGNQRVRRVSPDGIISTVAGGGSAVLGDGGPATLGQLNYPSSIALDSRGNLFIGELGRVRKVSADGIITTVAGGGPNSPDVGGPATGAGLHSAVRVAVDRAGNLFIADQNYDENNDSYDYVIRRVSPDGIISTLTPIPACCNGEMAADAAGNLFVPAGPVVWRVSPDGSRTVAAGNGIYGAPSGDGQAATKAQLNWPAAVALDAAGVLYIADNVGRNIRKVTPDGIIRPVASIPGVAPIPSGDGGPAVNAPLQLAVAGLSIQSGLAADSAGNLYIAETGAHRVRKVSPSGTITTVAGTGVQRCYGSTCLPLGDGGPAISAALFYPTSVAVDSAGNLFIADSSNLRVRKVSPDGIITTVAGNGSAPDWMRVAVNGGPATDTAVIPFHVAVDGAGNLYISEGNFADVRKVAPDGTIGTTLLRPGSTSSYFSSITATTVDRAGNLFMAGFVCDDNDNCSFQIRKISPDGSMSTVAAANPIGLQPGSDIGDGGPALKARLGFVSDLAVDLAGNLYIADLVGQRIRKIDGSGMITTVGGNGTSGYSGDGGPATNGVLSSPFGLAIDAGGSIYVSDFNQSVRVIRPVVP